MKFPLRWEVLGSLMPTLGPFPPLHMSRMRVHRPSGLSVAQALIKISLHQFRGLLAQPLVVLICPFSPHIWVCGPGEPHRRSSNKGGEFSDFVAMQIEFGIFISVRLCRQLCSGDEPPPSGPSAVQVFGLRPVWLW